MDKSDNIIDYYMGNRAYTSFLYGILTNDASYLGYIFDKRNINSAIVGSISNIFLAIKEELVDKEDGVKAKIALKELEKSVNIIADKTKDGYVINNCLFKDSASVVNELRNKLAHGNFRLDLDHSRVIFDINNQDVVININKLSSFVVSGLRTYLKVNNSSEYKRDFMISGKMASNRKKSINSVNELTNFLKGFKEVKIVIKRRDGKLIYDSVIKRLEEVLDTFKSTKDNKVLYEFKKEVKKDYDFDYNISSIKGIDYDRISENILRSIPSDMDYNTEVYMVAKEFQRQVNVKYNKINPIISNLENLIFLQSIKKYNTTDINVLRKRIFNDYGSMNINYDNFLSAGIGMFNSLFSYANDDIYKNNNKFTNLDNDGLEYDLLDLSKVVVERINIDDMALDILRMKKKTKEKEIGRIDKLMIENYERLLIVKSNNNSKAIEKLTSILKKYEDEKNVLVNELQGLNNSIFELNEYYSNNILYLTNERIISGIRNSIAHGNYEVIFNTNMEDSYVIFEDIYKGISTFKCRVKIIDFINILWDSYTVVEKFINKDKVVMVKKK